MLSYQNTGGPGETEEAFENSGQAHDADMDELYSMGDIDDDDVPDDVHGDDDE